jgi:hypothetical protein
MFLTVEEKLKGQFCDGVAHRFMYKRENGQMWIKVGTPHRQTENYYSILHMAHCGRLWFILMEYFE